MDFLLVKGSSLTSAKAASALKKVDLEIKSPTYSCVNLP